MRGAKRGAWIPAYISDLWTSCLAPGRPPPQPKTMDGANTSVKSRTATLQPHRRSTGSPENGPRPFEEHDQTIKSCASRAPRPHPRPQAPPSTRLGPCFWSQKQMLVIFSRLARWNKCWELWMLSCGIALITGKRPDLVEGVVANHPPPDTAFTQRDVEEGSHPSLRPQKAPAALRTWRRSPASRKNADAA